MSDAYIWNVLYNYNINRVNHHMTDVQRTASDAREESLELRQTVRQLTVVTQAMWELLTERTGVSDTDLADKIHAIEQRIAKAGATTVPCPACKRNHARKRDSCLYCGTRLPPGDAFDKLTPG